MIRQTTVLMLFLFSIKGVAGQQDSDSLQPYKLTGIAAVAIKSNGLWSDAISGDETPSTCAKFVLKQADVREFFRRARQVSYKEYGHDLDMSRCHAAGTVAFANGDKGNWTIDLERRGTVTLSSGKTLYFYCRECHAKAFDTP